MKYCKIIICLLSILILTGVSNNVFAAESKEPGNNAENYFYPMFGYSPETDFELGAGYFQYNQTNDGDQSVPANNLFNVSLLYTQEKQFEACLDLDQYLNQANNRFMINVLCTNFPSTIYTIGSNVTPFVNGENYTSIEYGFSGSYFWKLAKNLYLGPDLELYNFQVTAIEDGGLLAQNTITGSNGTSVAGIGAHLLWDERDNYFYPSQGFYLELKGDLYQPSFGSDQDFSQFYLDYRNYWQLAEGQILAFQSYAIFSAGDVPFELMPSLGYGQNTMRGYQAGEYNDKNYITLQEEYRFRVYKRLGMVLFAAVGELSPAISDFNFSDLKTAAGFGVRYQINEKQKINLHLDVGFSPSGANEYFGVGEAF